MLELRQVCTFYGNIQALYDIDIQIKEGEIITLIGSNGAGKSTTLMSISGVVPCQTGKIVFKGREIQNLSPDKIVNLGISQVPEGRHIFPDLTVSENLRMGAFIRQNHQEIKDDLDYVFSLFPILLERRKQLGGNLSGGEQQMLAISRALMARPLLLLLDEPSMGLAPIITRQIFDIIKKINADHKVTIFLIAQNANLALKIADKAYVMENGKIVMKGSGSTLLVDKNVRKAYMGI